MARVTLCLNPKVTHKKCSISQMQDYLLPIVFHYLFACNDLVAAALSFDKVVDAYTFTVCSRQFDGFCANVFQAL